MSVSPPSPRVAQETAPAPVHSPWRAVDGCAAASGRVDHAGSGCTTWYNPYVPVIGNAGRREDGSRICLGTQRPTRGGWAVVGTGGTKMRPSLICRYFPDLIRA